MIYDAVMELDGQGRPLYSPLPFMAEKNMVFAGATVNDPGDYTGGTGNPATLFTVTGDVLAYLIALCKTSLVGAATLEAGLTGNTAILLAQIADVAASLDENMNWLDATPAIGEGQAPIFHPIAGGLDIIQTVGTANITAGEIDYYCFWRPLSSDGLIVAA
jgi:hypothetical protein